MSDFFRRIMLRGVDYRILVEIDPKIHDGNEEDAMAERGISGRRQLRSACGLLLLAIFGAVSAYGQTPQEKTAAFAAIRTKWESLPGLDSSADNAELLAFLRTRPEFSDSGIVDGSSCVWAKFNDGRLLILANNFELDPPSPAATSETAARPQSSQEQASSSSSVPGIFNAPSELPAPLAVTPELPRSRRARLIHTIGGWPTAVPDIRPWLVAAGYDVVDDPGTLASLRAQSADPTLDGVLYMEAHAGLGVSGVRPPATRFALWTADEVDPLNEDSDPTLSIDLSLERVVYFAGKEVLDPVTREKVVKFHYGITDDFVTKYWSFAGNSLVYLTACGADGTSPGAQDFKKAILAQGAGVYASWSQNVHAGIALDTARLVFDRFLGANDPGAFPEFLFKQRPFDWQSVGGDPLQSDLARHNKGIDTSTGALLSFTPNSIAGLGDFFLLAPAIIVGQVLEASLPGLPYPAGTLNIFGTFGRDPRPDPDSKVTVGGLDCPVQFAGWQPGQISCDIPPAAGDVVVTVRKHESNKARLTKWNGTFRYSVRGADTLQVDIVYRVALRVDIRKVRLVIHELPVGPVYGLSNIGIIPDESSASYLCSGSSVTTVLDTTRTITWTGAGNMPASRVVPASADSFDLDLTGLPGPNVDAGFDHGANPGCNWTDVTVTPSGTITATGRWNLEVPRFDIGPLAVEPNDPSFPAGFRNLTGQPGCNSGLPTSQSTVLQCRIEWEPILATFPPDADSAR